LPDATLRLVDEALEALRQALDASPRDGETVFDRADVLWHAVYMMLTQELDRLREVIATPGVTVDQVLDVYHSARWIGQYMHEQKIDAMTALGQVLERPHA
jgi:hypothetical protein